MCICECVGVECELSISLQYYGPTNQNRINIDVRNQGKSFKKCNLGIGILVYIYQAPPKEKDGV